MAIGQQVGKLQLRDTERKQKPRPVNRRRRAIAISEDRPRAKMGKSIQHPLWNTHNLFRGVK